MVVEEKPLLASQNGSAFDFSSPFDYSSIVPKDKRVHNRKYKSYFTYKPRPSDIKESEDQNWNEHWSSRVLRAIITYFCYTIVIVTSPVSLWFCLKRILSLERLVVFRLGRIQPIKGPGFALVLPCIDKYILVNLRLRTFTVLPQQLLTADGGIIRIGATISYQVTNVIHFVTKARNPEEELKELGLRCLGNLVSQRNQDDLENERKKLQLDLQAELNKTVLAWGLDITELEVPSVQVLKKAEGRDTVSMLMQALKSSLSPGWVDECKESASTSFTCQMNVDAKEIITTSTDAVLIIQQLADRAAMKGVFDGINAIFKVEVTGPCVQIIYCCFQDGCPTVYSGAQDHLQPDVSLVLSTEDLQDFISSKLSPLQAYMEGRIIVTGDWSLLRTFSKVLN